MDAYVCGPIVLNSYLSFHVYRNGQYQDISRLFVVYAHKKVTWNL